MTRHMPEQTRRQQILEAARHAFIERGYYPTRMDDVAEASGLSKGGVYFHFKSKRDVFDALVEEEYERSMQFLKSVQDSKQNFMEKMQLLASHYLEYFQSAKDAPRFFIVMGEMALRDQELAIKLKTMQQTFINEIAKLLQEGVKDEIIKPLDMHIVAALLKALLDGLEGLSALEYSVNLPEFLSTGMELILGGLLKEQS